MQREEGMPLATLAGVVKRYGSVTALDGVDLAVHAGELLALLGSNGAGKSSAIACWLGLVRPEQGTARLFGQTPQSLSARRRAGVMLQSARMPDALCVGELLEQTRGYYPQPLALPECVRMAGLDGLLQRRYGRLSGGQQRRVQFAMAICGRPRVLFLDEPGSHLDVEARGLLWQTIRALVADGCAVVLTTHDLEEAGALADRVTVLAHGQVVAQGSQGQIRARVTQRRIRCISRLDLACVSAWPQVGSVHRDGERIEIITDAAEAIVRQLLREDAGLTELEVQRASLAEAFVQIVREAA